MKNKKTYVLTLIVCLIPLIAGAVLYGSLPDEIVINWGANGAPNDTTGKFNAVFVYPGILLIVDALFPFLLRADPKNRGMSAKIENLVMWIIPAVELLCSGLTLMYASGVKLRVDMIASLFFGLMIVIIGNYLPKMKQSYTVGIKLPWTLESEENWDRTHRFAGFVFVLCGLAVIACSFFHPSAYLLFVLAGVMLALPIVYSYSLYRKARNGENRRN